MSIFPKLLKTLIIECIKSPSTGSVFVYAWIEVIDSRVEPLEASDEEVGYERYLGFDEFKQINPTVEELILRFQAKVDFSQLTGCEVLGYDSLGSNLYQLSYDELQRLWLSD